MKRTYRIVLLNNKIEEVFPPEVMARLRKTCDGPVPLAPDYMVWNVTKDDIRVRMAAIDEEIFPPPAIREKQAPEGTSDAFSEFISSGFEAFPEVLEPIWDEINEIYGTDYKPERRNLFACLNVSDGSSPKSL